MPSEGIHKSPVPLTAELIRKAVPGASEGYIKYVLSQQSPGSGGAGAQAAAPTHLVAGVSAQQQKRDEGRPLARGGQGKAKGTCGFEVDFVVCSRRPCDSDGYCIKQLLDAVVRAGIIPDDDANTVVWTRTGARSVRTQDREGTLIEIYQRETCEKPNADQTEA